MSSWAGKMGGMDGGMGIDAVGTVYNAILRHGKMPTPTFGTYMPGGMQPRRSHLFKMPACILAASRSDPSKERPSAPFSAPAESRIAFALDRHPAFVAGQPQNPAAAGFEPEPGSETGMYMLRTSSTHGVP